MRSAATQDKLAGGQTAHGHLPMLTLELTINLLLDEGDTEGM
jgi:hypothetical protein